MGFSEKASSEVSYILIAIVIVRYYSRKHLSISSIGTRFRESSRDLFAELFIARSTINGGSVMRVDAAGYVMR